MNIGIDARFYGAKNKGLGRYTQKLIEEIEKIDNQNNYFIFLKKDNFNEYQPKNEKFKKILANYQWYGFLEQILFPLKIKRLKIDLMHFPHFNVPLFSPTKFIVTIHDLIPFYFPSRAATQLNPLLYRIKYLGYKLVISKALQKSQKIIAVSNFTKQDILKNFPNIPDDKINVIYEGSDFYQENQEYSKNNQNNKYILYIGSAYPHKNLKILISAFNGLDSKFQNAKLVIVGDDDYFFKKLKNECGANQNIAFIDNPPDNQLIEIYKNAAIYVAPSIYEGFGLPALEALKLGIPAIVSDIQIFHEILDNAALYFNPINANSLKEKIENLFEDENLKSGLIKKGLLQAEKYKWSEMAEKILNLYRCQYTNLC